ncbi:NHL repeat-containing protein [candidate division TA06 bacterium]|nr:NHL repeat-containing protein [candidate division TA06 bacterium]
MLNLQCILFLILLLGCVNTSEVRREGEGLPSFQFLFAFGSTGSEPGSFIRPSGIVMDLEGFLYVSDTGNNRIQKFTGDGKYVTEFGAFGQGEDRLAYPSALATNGISLFVADERNERVVQYNRYGNFSGTLLSSDGRGDPAPTKKGIGRIFPMGIAISKGNEVFVTDREGDRVIVLDLSGRVRRIFGKAGGRLGDLLDPVGIALDEEGQVYVSDTGNGRVQVFDLFGGPISILTTGLSQPQGIAIDRWGNLFVADLNEIKIFDRWGRPLPPLTKGEHSGSSLQMTTKGNLHSPSGIFITRENRLYVSDTRNDRVVVYQIEY